MQSCLKQGAAVNLFKSHSVRTLYASRGDNEGLAMNTVVVFSGTTPSKDSSRIFY